MFGFQLKKRSESWRAMARPLFNAFSDSEVLLGPARRIQIAVSALWPSLSNKTFPADLRSGNCRDSLVVLDQSYGEHVLALFEFAQALLVLAFTRGGF